MAAPKLRVIFYEEEDVESYVHIEKSEALRIISILKILPTIHQWTPVSTISKLINSKLPATIQTVTKIAGALCIELKINDEIKTIAKRPVILLRKEQHNSRSNLTRQKYLRPTIYVRHFRK